jgi:hypothetical protein
MKKSFGRFVVLTLLVAVSGIFITRSLTPSTPFAEQTARLVVIQGQRANGQCTLTENVLKSEPLWLVDICDSYGLAGYEAARRYTKIAPTVFGVYGEIPEFREVLDAYGHSVIPIIAFFVENGSKELLLRQTIGGWIEQLGNGEKIKLVPTQITPEQYGLLAIYEIKTGGHNFLGQFTIVEGVAKRLELKRAFFTAENLFAGGLFKLEEVLKRGERLPSWGEIGEAAIDGTIVLGAGAKALNILRGTGKVVRIGKGAEGLAKVSTATRVLEVGKLVGKTTLIGIPVGLAGFAVLNPVWTTEYAGWIAEQMGLSWWTGAIALWIVVGGIFAMFVPFAIPLVASILLWLLVPLLKLSGKAGFKISRFAIVRGVEQIRALTTKPA